MDNDIKTNILLVEDDEELAELTKDYLINYGYSVSVENNGQRAIERILKESPELLILDIMLPDVDGIEVCRRVREKYQKPILMLTARTDQIDQILGLEMGADDYVCKPVEPRLLLARIKALLRRVDTEKEQMQLIDNEHLQFDNLVIDNGARCVMLSGKEILLSSPEYDLLWLLAKNAGKILSREAIFSSLRGISYDGMNRMIDITISHIRTKISDDPNVSKRIKTIRNKGYMFVRTLN